MGFESAYAIDTSEPPVGDSLDDMACDIQVLAPKSKARNSRKSNSDNVLNGNGDSFNDPSDNDDNSSNPIYGSLPKDDDQDKDDEQDITGDQINEAFPFAEFRRLNFFDLNSIQVPDLVPFVSLRSIVITPNANVQIYASRESTAAVFRHALENNIRTLAIFMEEPRSSDVNVFQTRPIVSKIGVLAFVILNKPSSDQSRITVRAFKRIRMKEYFEKKHDIVPYISYEIVDIPEVPIEKAQHYVEALNVALDFALDQQSKKLRMIIEKGISLDMINGIRHSRSLSDLVDGLTQVLVMPYVDKKFILDTVNPIVRAQALIAFLNNFSYRAEVEKKITEEARATMERNQKDYFLHEQLKAIKRELNIMSDDGNDVEDYYNRLNNLDAPENVISRIRREISRLAVMPLNTGEITIVRSYIETLLSIPWRKSNEINNDLRKAQAVLNAEHYGLEKVKDRILEFLAVQARKGTKEHNGHILCLMGPPGIGKTSLGASIAKATGRKYVRVALGGMYDESEIRGHRRTYIGAMPGRIIQSLIKCESNNPLFLLDEIDKVSPKNIHGDIASALLEVLDPEQNKAFVDNYVDLDFDLSQVLFIATANSYNIPSALLDRMEIMDLSSYTLDEKYHIAREHLLPKQLKNNALSQDEFDISDEGLKYLIEHYAVEAGVRRLERVIAELGRKIVKDIMLNPDNKKRKSVLGVEDIAKLIGPKRYDYTSRLSKNTVGVVNGLSVSTYGGDVLQVEVIANEGKGAHLLTGQLGSVMKESVSAAISWVRSQSRKFGLAPDFYQYVDLHVHFPEGAIKKDGPSAGTATVTAIVSALTGNPVRADVAMTGEITLRGDVLPIGGVREKLLAALRGGIKTVCIPKDNEKDLWDVPQAVKDGLNIVPVEHISEVLDIALEYKPTEFTPQCVDLWTLPCYLERDKKRKLKEQLADQKLNQEIKEHGELLVINDDPKKDKNDEE